MQCVCTPVCCSVCLCKHQSFFDIRDLHRYNIIGQVVNKIKQAGQFVLQLDEMTDVSGDGQLLAFACYKDVSDIKEHILFFKRMPAKTTREEMFQVIDTFFKEHDLRWKSCSHICTDGAAAMTGSMRGLSGHVKKVNPDIKWMHCIIHRKALASKRLSPDISAFMDNAVKMINFIQSRPLNQSVWNSVMRLAQTTNSYCFTQTSATETFMNFAVSLCFWGSICILSYFLRMPGRWHPGWWVYQT